MGSARLEAAEKDKPFSAKRFSLRAQDFARKKRAKLTLAG